MGTITIADNKFYFDTPVVIEGETISYVENEDVNFILATDLVLANRFFKEMVFRQKKFNRVRLDGIDAKKEDQLSDKFEDYKMSIFARPDLSAFPTEEQILKKEDCMVNGRPHSSLAIAFSIDQYADTKTKMDIDRRKRELSEMKEKIKLELTQSEYKLLLLFLDNKNIVLERDVILDKIFDSNGSFVDDNTLSVYMKRLRSKLGEEYMGRPYIKTVRGIGYIMEELV